MKPLLYILSGLLIVVGAIGHASHQDKTTRVAKAAKHKQEREARLDEMRKRADRFDMQFIVETDKPVFFEVNVSRGEYRYENEQKAIVTGTATVAIDGCHITLTDYPKLLATINPCTATAQAVIQGVREAFYLDGTDCVDCEKDDTEH